MGCKHNIENTERAEAAARNDFLIMDVAASFHFV